MSNPSPDLEAALKQSVEIFRQKIKDLRVGRPSADMFENLQVEAYKVTSELKTLASFSVEPPVSIVIRPWDRNIISEIAEAVRTAQPNVSVTEEADKIRVNIPPLTQETRDKTVEELHNLLEEARVAVRHTRHKYMEQIDAIEGGSQDEQKRQKENVQKEVDATNKILEELSTQKEEDLKHF